jgi:predicted glycogen debranching enzyme
VADPGRIGNTTRTRRGLTPPAQLPECRVTLANGRDPSALEWLVTNGLGGYGSGTVSGDITRRYHGLLVAALPNPLGRTVMLNALSDSLQPESLRNFRLVAGMPVWRYAVEGRVIEKRITMPRRQNTIVVQYRLIEGDDFRLELTPAVHFRNYEAEVSHPMPGEFRFVAEGPEHRIVSEGYPPLHFFVEGHARFIVGERRRDAVAYPVEESRGYQARGALWTPGTFDATIRVNAPVALIASTDNPEVVAAITADEAFEAEIERKRRMIEGAASEAHSGAGPQLVTAADQFVIKPVGRVHDTVRATARGEGIRTVIAGYHWFTDWGRDTMISLEGLTLSTGRTREARFILRTFAQYVRDGLIPNLFPDGSDEGLYHTADATLWFFHAVDRYADVTGDWGLVASVLPTLRGIINAHVAGTHFGIKVDPQDGLLRQGAEGYQLTWMDAKVDGWVVTPRRGKAVEINALWHNALCALASWEEDFGDKSHAQQYSELASRARASFNSRFWRDDLGHLNDVVDGPDGDDPACRPNQLFAISLPHPVLEERRWQPVLDVVERKLLTPVGLRSLAPDHPDYKAKYFGNLRERDAAYHQGTVWGWLIGPWIDAWLKVHPDDKAGARRFLDGVIAHLPEFGVGSIAEVFDAEAPYAPRGCIAQAWSVAEALRCWVKTG